MKIRIFVAMFLMFLNCLSAYCLNIQDNYTLIYTIVGSTGDYINAQAPSIKIQKMSNSYWYDFSDNSFKIAGVVQSSETLTENATGQFYFYTFNPPATESTPNQYNLTITNVGTYADHQVETIFYDNVNFNHSADTVTVVTNMDKTGYGATSATVTVVNDKTGYSIAGTKQTLDAMNDISTTTVTTSVWNASTSTYVTSGSTGKKLGDLPLSGTGDWTAGEKTAIKEALSVYASSTPYSLQKIDKAIKVNR